MDFTVMRNGVNVYHNYKNLPWLTCDEVKEIRDTIDGIMDGSIKQNKRLYFLEQDIDFEFIFDDGERRKRNCIVILFLTMNLKIGNNKLRRNFGYKRRKYGFGSVRKA